MKNDLIKDNESFIKQFHNGFTRILILWIISKEKIHGYGISKKLDEFFGLFQYIQDTNPAKIYPILKKMEDKGLIVSEQAINNNKKIKYYQITDKGDELLDLIRYKWGNVVKDNIWREFLEDMIN